MPKANICVIGLSKKFTDDVCRELAIKFDMFYANAEQIIEFDLIDLQHIEDMCGRDYLAKKESSIIRRIASYTDTVINLEYHHLANDVVINSIRESSLIIYLKLNEKRFAIEQQKERQSNNVMQINADLMSDRDIICQTFADIVVDCDNLDYNELTELIIKKIVEFYP